MPMKNTDELQMHLASAAEAAHRALHRVQPDFKAFLGILSWFEQEFNAASVVTTENKTPGIQEATENFRTRYHELRGKLDGLVALTSDSLCRAYSDFERDASFVTIMLFGRTRAGKSTTMEALTGGDGASIGIGRQHTTTEVRAYYFPRTETGEVPSGPALRIVDTPGIDGYEGEALAAMAEAFVDRSDHILFLLTDDKATADELERFRAIKAQGKNITVLLNVKASDEDLDLLMSQPELIFRADEIEGHTRRICGYLERRFDLPPPRLIPLHARAAWLGRSTAELPEAIESRDKLVRNSRLPDVERRIAEFIRNEALPARLCAPRDLLLSHLWPLKDLLRPFAGKFSKLTNTLEQLKQRLEMGSERARQKAVHRLPLLRTRFQSASDAIPGMLDTVIATGGRGKVLNDQWKHLLITHGIYDASSWFIKTGQQDFENELAEEVRSTSFDYQFAKADDLDGLLADYHESSNNSGRNKYARAGIRTAGGAGAGVLATWAVANWWNPTGWVALTAAAVIVASAGSAGEQVARLAANEWEGAEKKKLHEKRSEIIAKLNERIWADHRGVHGVAAEFGKNRTLRFSAAA